MSTARRSRRTARGVVLLEVLIALTILAVAGIAIMQLARESVATVARTRASGTALERASDFLEAVALWPRADLDRHLGGRPEGAWRLRVERPSPTLYTVVLMDSARARVLLSTTLYRPETRDAQR